MRRCRSLTRLKHAASIVRSTVRELPRYLTASVSTSFGSSPITLLASCQRAYRLMGDDRTKHDMEHYARMAMAVIDMAMERQGRVLTQPLRERPSLTEQELVERMMGDASAFADSFAELISWLETSQARKAGITGTKRGNERVPRLFRE
jgi:predicted short-subunit dehydrogenase-like oxidoreductase (DUF2520 family)